MLVRIILAIAFIILAPLFGGLLAGLERKLSARMQRRVGPPITQSFKDLKKLFNKEAQVVNKTQTFLVISYLVFMVVTGALFFAGADLLLVFFTLTTSAIFFVVAAAVTRSPFSAMGVNREMIQMMSYEPMVLLTAVGFYLAAGSFEISSIISGDWMPIIKLPGVFLGFLFILTIKLRKSPFDVSTSHHAHQEIVKGITTEMSGPSLGMIELSEWYEKIFLLGVVGMFFVNSNPLSYIVAVVVALFTVFLEVLIDNTSARLTWQQMLKSSWLVTLILGGINIVVLSILK